MSGVSVGERALIDRVGSPDYRAWRRQVERVGYCSHPVRITGSATAVDVSSGEVRARFATAEQPDGTLLVACGDRRAAVCARCSEVYRRDLWHVVASGLAGRLSPSSGATETGGVRQSVVESAVPASVGEHPAVFVTLTAPSFGAVHSARGGGVCRPRSTTAAGRVRTCAHGRPLGCGLRHGSEDAVLGRPLCEQCWDYTGAVLWNACVGELWRRTRIAADRALAPLASEVVGRRLSRAAARKTVRVSYVKVAEFQRRGLVHLHLVARLDGVDPDDASAVVAPPAWASATLLASAVRRAVSAVGFALPSPDGRLRVAAWGTQYDVTDVHGGGAVGDARRVGAYLAKYATKTASDSVGASAVLARRLHRLHREYLRRKLGGHLTRLVETAWELGGRRELAHLRLRAWAHTLGFRGHLATKSRAYSLTLGALRRARRAWRARQTADSGRADVWHAAAEGDSSTVIVGEWRYVGRGYVKAADLGLVEMMAREHQVARAEYRALLAREKALAKEIAYWCDPPPPPRGSTKKTPRAKRDHKFTEEQFFSTK